MNPFVTLRIALRALSRNRLRSFLTTLGVIIGVAAVITMTAIGEGAKARISAAFASMGTNMLVISPGSTSLGGVRGGSGTMPSLTWEDLAAIQREVQSVRAAAAVLRSNASLVSETSNWSTSIQGTSPEYFEVRNWPMASGSAITQSDVDAGAKVIVLGQTVVDQLFGPHADVIGQVVRIRQVPFNVVGVAAKKGQSPMGQDYDDTAFVPQTTFAQKIQGGLGKYVARAERHHRPFARAPPAAPERGRRFSDPEPGRDRQRAGGGHAHHDHAPRERRGGLAARRGHRHHEHHAGLGDGADA
jgi:putative ABC transport system permease protein